MRILKFVQKLFEKYFIKWYAVGLIFTLRLYGIVPFSYDRLNRCYYTKWYHLLYSIIFGTILSVVFIVTLTIFYEKADTLFQNISTKYINLIFFILLLITVLSNYSILILNVRKYAVFLNDIQALNDKIAKHVMNNDGSKGHLQRAMIFVLFRNVIISVSSVVLTVIKNSSLIFEYKFQLICMLLVTTTPTTMSSEIYFSGMTIIRTYFEEINLKIKLLVDTLGQTSQQNNVKKCSIHKNMKKYCELSDRLDELAILHFQVTSIAKRLTLLLSLQIFVHILRRATRGLLILFFIYISFKNVINHYSSYGAWSGSEFSVLWMQIFDLIVQFWDIYTLTNVTCNVEIEVRYTI